MSKAEKLDRLPINKRLSRQGLQQKWQETKGILDSMEIGEVLKVDHKDYYCGSACSFTRAVKSYCSQTGKELIIFHEAKHVAIIQRVK